MAWRRPGDKLLSEPMMVSLLSELMGALLIPLSYMEIQKPMLASILLSPWDQYNTAYLVWHISNICSCRALCDVVL